MTEPTVSTTESAISSSGAEVRVLLIDDSKSARRLTAAQLSAAGFSVITASDGFSALADVVECHPHVIVADIVMPRLDGYQTCALIKHSPEYQAIPVVLVSSRDGLFDRARGRLVGADAHLAKPFTDEDLIGTIYQCIDSTVAKAGVATAGAVKKSELETSAAAEINFDDTVAAEPV